jgi:hypothetical protein
MATIYLKAVLSSYQQRRVHCSHNRRRKMIIADLNYLEVAEETSVVGADGWGRRRLPSAKAHAVALADAIGFRTKTFTGTDAQAVAGLFSSSASESSASAIGLPIKA